MLLSSGGEGFLSDCKNLGLGSTLRREAELHGAPLKWVFNTHHHGDHSGGNYAFAADLPLVAHPNAVPRIRERFTTALAGVEQTMARTLEELRGGDADTGAALSEVESFMETAGSLSPDDFLPTVMVPEEREIRVGSHTVQLRHVSPGHTDNDIFLFVPEENVLHTGDLLFHQRHPFIDTSAGATTVGWQRCVEAMVVVCDGDTVVIPGHGPITDRGGLQGQGRYFDQIREVVHGAMRGGMSREEIIELEPSVLAELGTGSGLARNLGTVYDELASDDAGAK
jgi:glyoxylase-like metal-dependent hydrolase (beta-lactamase superfamily II)